MHAYQRHFIEFCLANQILRFGDFTLKSGRKSPYFFNAGLVNDGKTLAEFGEFFAQAIISHRLKFDVLFGPAYKGIPLVTACAIALEQNHQINKPFCFNRKEIKKHGEGGQLVGAELIGNVCVIDDVITAGTAKIEAANIIQQQGANLSQILIGLDRQERGNNNLSACDELAKTLDCQIISIINLQDLIAYLENENANKPLIQAISQYQAEFGCVL